MGKKRKKFKSSFQSTAVNTSAGVAVNPVLSTVSNSSASSGHFTDNAGSSLGGAVYNTHTREYQQVRNDLLMVLLVNGLLFAAIVVMYLLDKQNAFLGQWYSKLF